MSYPSEKGSETESVPGRGKASVKIQSKRKANVL